MWRNLNIVVLALVVSCADTPDREDPDGSSGECPAWKIAVTEEDRIICVDENILEREREIIESEERW
jgi:hypothetical protein